MPRLYRPRIRQRTINPGGDDQKIVTIKIDVASNVNVEIPVFVNPNVDSYLQNAKFINNADIATNDTNYRSFALKDKAADGNGTTAASTVKTTQVTGGAAITDFVDYDLAATSGYKLAAGNVLSLDISGSGTEPVLNGVLVLQFK